MIPQFIGHTEIDRLLAATAGQPKAQLEILTDICRANTLAAIKSASRRKTTRSSNGTAS